MFRWLRDWWGEHKGQIEVVVKDSERRRQRLPWLNPKDEWIRDDVPCERITDGLLEIVIAGIRSGDDTFAHRGYNLGTDTGRLALMLALDLRDARRRHERERSQS